MSCTATLGSTGDRSYLRLSWPEGDRADHPGEFLAEVTDGEFTGKVRVCIFSDDLEAFAREVRACERAREGAASLASCMGPDELKVGLVQSDGWGHFILRYELHCFGFTRRGGIEQRLCGEFHLDTERFDMFASDLEAFAASVSSERRQRGRNDHSSWGHGSSQANFVQG